MARYGIQPGPPGWERSLDASRMGMRNRVLYSRIGRGSSLLSPLLYTGQSTAHLAQGGMPSKEHVLYPSLELPRGSAMLDAPRHAWSPPPQQISSILAK